MRRSATLHCESQCFRLQAPPDGKTLLGSGSSHSPHFGSGSTLFAVEWKPDMGCPTSKERS